MRTPAKGARRGAAVIYAMLLLLIAGILFVLAAIDVYALGVSDPMGGVAYLGYIPWVYLVALAAVSLGAGFIALPRSERPTHARVEGPSRGLPNTGSPAHAGARSAAESPSGTVSPAPGETTDLDEDDDWPESEMPPEPLPPHVVLGQVDEIEASLRKRPPPSQSS